MPSTDVPVEHLLLWHLLLLDRLLSSLITTAKHSHRTSHCSPGRRAFSRVASDCTSYRSKGGTAPCTSYDMTPRRLIGRVWDRSGDGRLSNNFARVDSGLADR